ncbi:contact-dependent growth inhibition system immunity protein [Streptomyces sp. 796.1]|uniref:contact-dependent growth inhibition system immunity protein n=1 Tax=Streptomyces sp. 796.1 TaxID=3163029 RepID=UPI0039C9DCA2
MPLKPREHDAKYGELDQVVRAYLGQPADDDPERPSAALTAYLRHTWQARPGAIATAERQLRDLAENPPGRLRTRLGEYYVLPDVGLPDAEIPGWLLVLAEHLKESVEQGRVPAPETPQTHWEWQARFPELGQLLGGWFSQDMPDEFADHGAALADYLGSTAPSVIARLVGEVHELLALGLDDGDYGLALSELGMEVDPPAPYGAGAWLVRLSAHLTGGAGGTGEGPALRKP